MESDLEQDEARVGRHRVRWIVAAVVGVAVLGLFAVPELAMDDRGRVAPRIIDASRPVSPTSSAPDPLPVLPILPASITAEVPPPMERLQSNPIPAFIRSGPTTNARMAITIDDLFGAAGTDQLRQVLDIAEARHVHLTLFPTGGALQDAVANHQEEIWRRAVRDGMEIGNHTFTHTSLLKLNDQQIRDELVNTQNQLNQVLGPDYSYRMRILRPPGGGGGMEANGNPRIMKVAAELGYSMVMWSIDSNYTAGFSSYADKIVSPSGAVNGSIVLLHFTTFSPANVASIIDRLRSERHLEPTSVSELFAP